MNKVSISKIVVMLIVFVTCTKLSIAQSTFFSLSEPTFYVIQDTSENDLKNLVNLSLKVSDISIATDIQIDLAETANSFTLQNIQGTIVSENESLFILINGSKQPVSGKYINISFALPTDIIQKWKFTRIYFDLQTGEKSRYLYHRW